MILGIIMQHCIKIPSPGIQLRKLALESTQSDELDSDTLFINNDVVFIMHHGERYLLRRTRNDKLILTK